MEIKFKIFGNTWSIQFVNNEHIGVRPEVDRPLYGLTRSIVQTIYIATGYGDDRVLSTIKHELTHAAIDVFGLDRESWNEEQLCEFMAIYAEKIINQANILFEQYKEMLKADSVESRYDTEESDKQ